MTVKGTYSFETADRIVAGPGSLESLGDFVRSLKVKKAALFTDPGVFRVGLTEKARKILEDAGLSVDVFPDVVPEPSTVDIEDIYAKTLKGKDYDVLVGVGGGSSLDATKILAVMGTNEGPIEGWVGTDKIRNPGIPTALIPTTAGTGSEVTPNVIVTLVEQELKVGIVSRHFLPDLVILDPALTVGLPPSITAATGMDAFIHSLESFISKKANPIADAFCLKSMALIARNLRLAYHDGKNLEARHNMLIGSTLGGMALTGSGTAAVHALAYPLGGKYKVSHGVSNSMLLVPVMEFNLSATEARLAEVAECMGLEVHGLSQRAKAEKCVEELRNLVSELAIPKSLREFGVKDEDLDALAASAADVTRLLSNNPREMTLEDIRAIYASLM